MDRMSTKPVGIDRTNRRQDLQILTSMQSGKMMPIAYVPLLREDRAQGFLDVNIEMMETTELLMNPVRVLVSAYMVPFLALDRFEGSMDQLNRSYMGQPKVDGGAVTPFFETQAYGAYGANPLYKYLGIHGNSADLMNTTVIEGYNQIWNLRAKNRSPNLALRARLDTSLAPAFWPRSRFAHIVPDFDQARVDGLIALNVVNSKLPIKGLANIATQVSAGTNVYKNDGTQEVAVTTAGSRWFNLVGKEKAAGNFFTDVYAEMSGTAGAISLSNIELAKKTQAWAKLRERYNEHSDEWLIDMLMQGLSVPDESLKRPFLISQTEATIIQAKRYASTAGQLDASVTNGMAQARVRLSAPQIPTGGIIMVVAEAVPEQLFERQKDVFLSKTAVGQLPDAQRDDLDPEKVEAVLNSDIDVMHNAPTGVFGYGPLNHWWNAFPPRVGGKFQRPSVDPATDTVRQRIWAVESANPTLSANFYIVSGIHNKVFINPSQDPFDVTGSGIVMVNGLTQFGDALVEATNDYAEVLEKAPTARIVK
ncbi:major capsid protein [Tortoise microvirus 76]|nr:major capsid protein [Tortoise microvirus 76]